MWHGYRQNKKTTDGGCVATLLVPKLRAHLLLFHQKNDVPQNNLNLFKKPTAEICNNIAHIIYYHSVYVDAICNRYRILLCKERHYTKIKLYV